MEKLCWVCDQGGDGPTPATHDGCEHLASSLVPEARRRFGLCDECHAAGPCPECDEVDSAARLLGRRGGLAGRGESQRRGDSAHYVALADMRKRPGRKPKKIEEK
jgi:hypothetical protein